MGAFNFTDQPFSAEEIQEIAYFSGVDPAKVKGIAWLTHLKLINEMISEISDRKEAVDEAVNDKNRGDYL